MNLPMEPIKLGLLIAILFFLISLLLNLVQRRYSKKRLDRMIMKDESFMSFLAEIDKYLGKLERNCTLEVFGESSPQETGKAIHLARNKIESTIDNISDYLRSFRQYRKREKAQGEKKKQRDTSRQKASRR